MTNKISFAVLLSLLIVAIGVDFAPAQLLEEKSDPSTAGDRKGAYRRDEIAGNYTVGFYSDDRGSSDPILLEEGENEFTVWLGVSGDSTRTFSAVVFRLELPYGLEQAGPVIWNAREKLHANGYLTENGLRVEFAQDCAQQTGLGPVILARIPLRLLPGVDELTLEPSGYIPYGLSIELCQPELGWPKPYAEPVSVEVRRQRSLWQKFRSWFD